MTLPTAQQIQVSVKPLPHFAARMAAAAAGGPPIDFMRATLIVGDGNQNIPAISDLMASGAVVHEVWRSSAAVHGVMPSAKDDKQLDILAIIPAVDANGNEIGPFWVTEFVLTDENGAPTIVGTTLAPKLTTNNGSPMDLAIIAAIGFSEGTVILTPPSAAFATFLDVEMAVNGHHPVAVAPLTQTDAIDNQGWLKRTFGAREASASLTGVGRVATPNEVANGEAADNTYQNPWVTPELLKPALDARMITSGVGVEVASNKTNLRIDALEPATALAPSDVLPLYQAAPPRHRRASLGALRDYFTVAHDDTLAGLGTAASPLGVAGVRPRAWVYFDGNQIIASAGFLAAEKFGGGGVKLYFSTPMPDANYAVIGTGMQNAAEIRVLLELRGMRSADAFAVQTAWQITSTTWADFSPFSLVVFR